MKTRLALSIATLLIFQPYAYGASVKNPEVKLNAPPRMRYEVTVHIGDAPGPFDEVSGHVDYRVSNEDCVPMTPVTGATIPPSKRVPLKLIPSGNDTYKAELFADLLQDEDYFGKGVCHWSIVATTVEARVQKMDFAASLPKEDMFGKATATRYYANRAYAESGTELINTGNLHRSEFKDPFQTFFISIQAKEKIQ